MKLNSQTPEKKDYQSTLEVHSIFSTIQGEGPFCGRPAVFVRLAGCNLQCPGCDTEYTQNRIRLTYESILADIDCAKLATFSNANLIVISGGEPFRQNIAPFCDFLIENDFDVQIETNGSMQIPMDLSQLVTVVCSPKTAKLHPSALHRANAFKYVMKAGNMREEDGLPLQALDHRATPYIARPHKSFRGKIYLQPMDEQDEQLNLHNTHAVLESAMKHNYTVQLQIHKLLNVE
nr:QueE-like radical SAM domain [Klebsiella phage vB_Ko_K4PH164]